MATKFFTPSVFIQEVPTGTKTIVGVPTSTAVILGTFPKGTPFKAKKMTSLQEFDRLFGGRKQLNLSSLVVEQFFKNGGQQVWVVSTGTRLSRTADSLLKGLSLVSKIRSFNTLFIPETTRLSDTEAAKIFAKVVPLAEKRQAIYLLDPPFLRTRSTAQGLVTWLRTHPTIQHPNVTLYFPSVQIRSPVSSTHRITIPASGTIAGVMARSDSNRGVWKAPAGTVATLQGVVGLGRTLTSQDLRVLTTTGINSLKRLTSSTIVAWGARTLSSDPEWKYLAVRRTALYLETSIKQGISWAVFEPNDAPLWLKIRQSVSTFLHTLFRQGAFQGTTAREAYVVKCGRETMSVADQQAGRLNLTVGFAPLKPAEFIIFRIQQKTREG